jgi:sulfite exporter TauE/SafE
VHHHPVLPASGDLPLLFLASLLGSSHCVAMCGPYVGLCAARMTSSDGAGRFTLPLRVLFNGGRLAVYVALGALAGAFGKIALALLDRAGMRGALALASGGVSVILGMALLGWIQDPARIFVRLGLDTFVRQGTRRAFSAPAPVAAVALGSLQGAFPCALVYAAAARAAAAGSAVGGAATMMVFGLGTVPAILVLSSISPRLLARLKAWRWAGGLVVVVGLLLVLRGLAGLGLVPHSLVW